MILKGAYKIVRLSWRFNEHECVYLFIFKQELQKIVESIGQQRKYEFDDLA